MPLHIIRQDIIKMDCDAIVCPTDPFYSASGGTDLMIHQAAGPALRAECYSLGSCNMGEAVITGAYRLPSKYVIHTVGPVWQGGEDGEEELLASCYKSCLALAVEKGLESIAFPVISAGTFGYPKAKAFRCAMNVLSDFLLENDMTVYLLVYDKEVFTISERLLSHVASFIEEDRIEHRECASPRFAASSMPMRSKEMPRPARKRTPPQEEDFVLCDMSIGGGAPDLFSAPKTSLEDALKEIDESFSQMLLRKIDESGMTDSQCYKKANIDRKLFSKIRSDVNYRPKKTTAIAFAIALELSRTETDELLKKAGFALSHSNKFDIIVEYFIDNGIYDIFEINEALFAFDQSLIGA